MCQVTSHFWFAAENFRFFVCTKKPPFQGGFFVSYNYFLLRRIHILPGQTGASAQKSWLSVSCSCETMSKNDGVISSPDVQLVEELQSNPPLLRILSPHWTFRFLYGYPALIPRFCG